MYKVTVARDIRNYLYKKTTIIMISFFLTELTMMISCRQRTFQLSEHLQVICNQELDNDANLFDFPLGIQYVVENQKSYATFWPENKFASILTRSSFLRDMNSIVPFSYPHDNPPSSIKKVSVSTLHPQWIQCIHRNNVSNSLFSWSDTYEDDVSLSMLLKLLRSKSLN